jgi:hypothetical protein
MRATLLLAGAAVLIATAAPADADLSGTDQAFLTTLGQAGLTFMNPDRAVAAAKSVCELADGGMTGAEIVKNAQDLNPGFQEDGAAKFVVLAVQAYCPQKIAKADAPSASQNGNP